MFDPIMTLSRSRFRSCLIPLLTTGIAGLLALAPSSSTRAGDFFQSISTGYPQALEVPHVPGPAIWKDPSQPVDARVKDLIRRMSLAEKVSQTRADAPAIPRLGIPSYSYRNECIHGVVSTVPATVFPQVIGMAATWDTSLIHKEADVISTEARAIYNDYAAKHDGNCIIHHGISFFAPNINIVRDPRWGRNQETYGEDPFLTAQMAVAFVRGLQGDNPKYFKVIACPKHYAVHDGPEPDRHRMDARPSQTDLYDTYLPAFEAAIRQAHAGGVMAAYSAFYGVPDCANPFLLTTLLRERWGFDGFVVSDGGAIHDIWTSHHYVPTPEQAAAVCVKAGCDLCSQGADYDPLVHAVQRGFITEKQIDLALSRDLRARFQLGLFDPPAMVPWSGITIAQDDTPAHEQLALKVAQESIVLLKNNGVLPLDRARIKRIAVIGPSAKSVEVLKGNYAGIPARPVTILEGIKTIAGPAIEVTYEPGGPLAVRRDRSNRPSPQTLEAAIAAARAADVVIYVGGLNSQLEGEQMGPRSAESQTIGFYCGDRTRIELPPVQTHLLKMLKATGKPIIFIDCSGSAVAMPWEARNLPAILQAWYPGEQGGRAVADVLFGNANPAGRLPVTFYRATSDLPEFDDYSMAGRTYRYFKGKPLFAFGYGLSYTKFTYTNARMDQAACAADGAVRLSFTLANTGARDGDEVSEVYFQKLHAGPTLPRLALCGFARTHLAAGQQRAITMSIPVERFRTWDTGRKQYVVQTGQYELLVGAASNDLRLRVPLRVE